MVQELLDEVEAVGGRWLVTADHGNAEDMVDACRSVKCACSALSQFVCTRHTYSCLWPGSYARRGHAVGESAYVTLLIRPAARQVQREKKTGAPLREADGRPRPLSAHTLNPVRWALSKSFLTHDVGVQKTHDVGVLMPCPATRLCRCRWQSGALACLTLCASVWTCLKQARRCLWCHSAHKAHCMPTLLAEAACMSQAWPT